ncbi:hypothetical protein F4825DRAFT_111702 [Nemania diffusa]|nr:hypothetical protein F4825DRAFT_111702 [Nemania diffusa]
MIDESARYRPCQVKNKLPPQILVLLARRPRRDRTVLGSIWDSRRRQLPPSKLRWRAIGAIRVRLRYIAHPQLGKVLKLMRWLGREALSQLLDVGTFSLGASYKNARCNTWAAGAGYPSKCARSLYSHLRRSRLGCINGAQTIRSLSRVGKGGAGKGRSNGSLGARQAPLR